MNFEGMQNQADTMNSAKDHVCRMLVIVDTAKLQTEYQGLKHFFCSNSCVPKLRSDPEKYIKRPV
jgi:YHS domain-containing protein